MIRIALVQPEQLQTWEHGEVARITELLQHRPELEDVELVTEPRSADLVVLLESCTFKSRHDLPGYSALLSTHGADRLMCINYEDGPPGFLPGLYSSLESFRYDGSLHRSWPHLRMPNQHADAGVAQDALPPARHLFTFSGACSHPLRRTLFERFEDQPGRHKVREIKRWYNHGPMELQNYATDISESMFVLCPRGIASYSHRILETLALGRVPVIIADHWVPFSIPDAGWHMRIEESRLPDIESILLAAEPDYPRMQHMARQVYQRYFRPEVRYATALRQLIDLRKQLPHPLTAARLEERWRGRRFWKSNGWCVEQRVLGRLRKLVSA